MFWKLAQITNTAREASNVSKRFTGFISFLLELGSPESSLPFLANSSARPGRFAVG
jgi:hypothetical protein